MVLELDREPSALEAPGSLTLEPSQRQALDRILLDGTLSCRQRVQQLAIFAENLAPIPPLSDAASEALDARVICDMYEGNAPYRPRYTLPDYAKALEQGSAYLELPPTPRPARGHLVPGQHVRQRTLHHRLPRVLG